MRESIRIACARVAELFRRRRLEAEREDEFRFHLEMQTEHNLRAGMTPAEARRAALLAFGGVERFRQQTRDARGIVAVENLVRDGRFAVRRLWRLPSFSIGVIATLAVGAGAAVAIGTLVYGVLLRPLPYVEPHQLVQVTFRTPGMDGGREHAHSPATYVHVRDAARSFSAIGAYHVNNSVNLTDGDAPARVTAVMITPGALAALRVVPALGRLFSDEDTDITGVVPVLITHALWQERYGADPEIIDRVIEINLSPRRIIGVLPRGFEFPVPGVAIYFPLSMPVERATLNSRYLEVVARLRSGAMVADAAAELRAVVAGLPQRFPEITTAALSSSGAHAEVVALRNAIVAPVREHLQMLAFTMLFVVLIAVANVTNLFLLRSERLRHEIAITTALGGGTVALIRRFTMEGAVLGMAAGIAALPIVVLALVSRFGFTHRQIPRLHEIGPGVGSLAAVLLLATVLGAAVGVIAFARARRNSIEHGLRSSERAVTGGWKRVQQGLVATQVAVALALVLSAALMGRSLWNLHQAELGFTPGQRASFQVTLPFRGYDSYARLAAFHTAVLDRLRAMPGVLGAEAVLEVPLAPQYPGELTFPITAAGTEKPEERAAVNVATPGYFQLMGIPLLDGRSFAAGDVASRTPGIVLSASLARALFGEVNAAGRLVRPPTPGDDDVFFRVVGVVGDIPRWRIEDGPARMAYFPQLRDGDGVQNDSVLMPVRMRGATYVLHSAVDLGELAPAMRAAIRDLDPRVPVTNITTLPALVDAATSHVRLTMLLLTIAAGAALLLGSVGIYSVVSYAVAGRRREFGVRLALGATRSGIQRLVLRDGVGVIALGVAAGLLAAAWAAQLARSMLYGVSPTEPALYILATTLFLVLAGAATLIPARRAAGIHPGDILRAE